MPGGGASMVHGPTVHAPRDRAQSDFSAAAGRTTTTPIAELREAFAFATWLGYPIRALNFVHMMGEADFAECRKDVAQFLVRWTEMRALLADPDELVAAVADQTEY